MNIIYRLQAQPYLSDPPLSRSSVRERGYMFPPDAFGPRKVKENISFTSNPLRKFFENNEIRQKTDKLRDLTNQIQNQNPYRKQLDTII